MKKSISKFTFLSCLLLIFVACKNENVTSVYSVGIYAFSSEDFSDLQKVENYLQSKGLKNGEIWTINGKSAADCDSQAKKKFDEIAKNLNIQELFDKGLHPSTKFVYRASCVRNGETFVAGEWNYVCPQLVFTYKLHLVKNAGKTTDSGKIGNYFSSKGLKILDFNGIIVKDKRQAEADETAKIEFTKLTDKLVLSELEALSFDSIVSVSYFCIANHTPTDTIARWDFTNDK